ncbi:amidohydrolase [Leucobacter komagatae]|uniref:Peptidase M20 domain-containing protein 2 n=1 Tax=Leucobacter komagatae TaxID=55969 RepID=A0A0D0IM43_9MICO|nr:amidohydrolase [Leucobacter komagatae]KIP52237.1 amidohydrolase [Leucobacter komagatae]
MTTDITTGAEPDSVRRAIAAGVDEWHDRVEALARELHANPELAFEEHRSAKAIAALLESGGFAVDRGVGGLDTAFEARAGSGPLEVVLCVEYDALPGIGHACGHNLIAGTSVAAALALAPVADELGITVRAIGTPAEEHGGGKSVLLERGAFDGAHLALMLHPVQDGMSYNPTGTSAQAVGRFRAVFSGKSAHAAAAPHLAVNAADAAVLSHVAIGLLRQQIRGDERIALVTREAGEVTNIIPDRAVVEFECRAFELDAYLALLERVRACFEGAAVATGTVLEISETEPLYEPLIQDDALAASWTSAMAALGYDTTPSAGVSGGSTDMGNVSQVIPSLHPWFSLPGATAPIHTHEFAAFANTPEAYRAMRDGAIGLAWTAAGAAAPGATRDRLLQSAFHSE